MMCVSVGVSVGECEDANEEDIAGVDKILIMNETVNEHICGARLLTSTNAIQNHTINS